MAKHYYLIVDGDADFSKKVIGRGYFPLDDSVTTDKGTEPKAQADYQKEIDAFLSDGRKAHELDLDQWNSRPLKNAAIEDGKWTTYEPEAPAVPVATQAATALQDIYKEAGLASAMGQQFGPKMQAYVNAVKAIADGEDTKSASLPAKPDRVTD